MDIEGWHSILFVILVAPDVDWSVISQSSSQWCVAPDVDWSVISQSSQWFGARWSSQLQYYYY